MARTCPGGRARLWRVVTPVALILLAVALPSAGHAVGDVRDAQHQELSDLDARVTSLAVLGASERLLFETFRDDSFQEPLKVAEALISMVLDGLRP